MQITPEAFDDYAILYLKGEFDHYAVKTFEDELDNLKKVGLVRIVVDLQFVRFINSTALGALVKTNRSLASNGGKLAVSRPSTFCRDIFERVGINRILTVVGSVEDAVSAVRGAAPKAAKPEVIAETHDHATITFAPADAKRIELFLKKPKKGETLPGSFVGRMVDVSLDGLEFSWSGGQTGLTPFEMGQMLAIGTEWRARFPLPMYQRGFCEAHMTIQRVEERLDGVRIAAAFKNLDANVRTAIGRYRDDMATLREEVYGKGKSKGDDKPKKK